jgi:hypothetical protein
MNLNIDLLARSGTQRDSLMSVRNIAIHRVRAALLLLALAATSTAAVGQTLVGNVFSTGFENWTDVNGQGPRVAGSAASWGVLLTDGNPIVEGSDGRVRDGATVDGFTDGNFAPFLLINNVDVTPANYTINATMGTSDNDGMGIVFGYVDENNYFRLSLRLEASSNFGYPSGTSIQKVVNGVTTQIYSDTVLDHSSGPFDVSLQVAGPNISVVFPGFTHNASDSDLQPGKYGLHSWGQKQIAAADRQYGTMAYELSVSSSTLNKTHDFANAVVADWRRLDMVNNAGVSTSTAGEFFGNFRQDFFNGRILDDTNGNLPGTPDANMYTRSDFIGPAVVIDEPGNAGWGNYVMATRLFSNDNDGMGVVFRVASDNSSFYRINFTNEGAGVATSGRPPRGMSMQKFSGGVWTELYADDQANPDFVYTPGVPFDLSVIAEGNTFKVGIVNDPDGAVTAINYDPIVDSSSPLLTGSVGFTNWGQGDTGFGAEFSAYGGGGTPLLSGTLPRLGLTIDRATGNVTLVNSGAALAIDYYELTSEGSSLNSTIGTGNNQWTPFDLAEADPVGQGWDPAGQANSGMISEGRLLGTTSIAASAQISLGEAYNNLVNAEDVRFRYRLENGMFVLGDVGYVGVAPQGLDGDFNADGIVDARDYTVWRNNLGNPDGVLNGNGDNSGVVDVADYTLWKNNFGQTSPGALATLQSVPEPGTWVLASLGALSLLRLRRRHWRGRSANLSQGMPIMSKTITTCLAVGMLLSLATQPAQAVLVGRYLLDGNFNDSSGNGYNGIAWGTPTFENDPTFGTVLRIPDVGDNGVDLHGPNPFPNFAANTSITLMAWYKRTSAPTGDFRYVVNLGQNGDNPIATLGVRGNHQIASYIESDQPGGNADQVNTFGTTVIEGGAAAWSSWHHLAIVYDRVTDIASVYLDGALDATNSIAAVRDDFGFTWPRVSIGRGPAGSSSSPGFIHDVQIYNSALTQAELLNAIGQPVFQATVNRTTGELTIENVSNVVGTFNSYALTSADGALDPNGWDSVTDNWDMGGPGSIDTNPWSVTSATNQLLSEAETPSVNGGTLAPGQSVNLGAAWIKSISENMTLEVNLTNGLKSISAVVFEGGIGDAPYMRSDLNFDGNVTLADWQILVGNLGSDFSAISRAQSYVLGDLNLDGISDGSDFATFRNDYDALNGAGAFAAALAQVPEPTTLALGLLGGVLLGIARLRRANR